MKRDYWLRTSTIVLLVGCGRIGFEPLPEPDATVDAPIDASTDARRDASDADIPGVDAAFDTPVFDAAVIDAGDGTAFITSGTSPQVVWTGSELVIRALDATGANPFLIRADRNGSFIDARPIEGAGATPIIAPRGSELVAVGVSIATSVLVSRVTAELVVVSTDVVASSGMPVGGPQPLPSEPPGAVYWRERNLESATVGASPMILARTGIGTPSVVATSAGYLVSWHALDGTRVVQLDSTGAPTGVVQLVDGDESTSTDLVWTGSDAAIVWRTANQTLFRLLSADGSPRGPTTVLFDGQASRAEVVWTGSGYLVAWTTLLVVNRIHVRELSATGIPTGDPILGPAAGGSVSMAWADTHAVIAFSTLGEIRLDVSVP